MLKLLLRLALRNILRNKRRSALTFASMIAGMASLICFGGFVSYTYWGLREITIHSELGHLQVFRAGYSQHSVADPFNYLISDFPRIKKEIGGIAGVSSVTARFGFSGLISKGERTLNCLATGVIPEDEKDLFAPETMIAGKKLSRRDQPGIVLGNELSRALGARVGDAVTLLTTTTTGMINAQDLEVVGIVRMGAKDYDRIFVKIPLSMAQLLLNTQDVEKIVVLLKHTEDTDKVATLLKQRFNTARQPLEIKTWEEMADFYHAVVRLYNGIFRVAGTIIAVLFLFGIANTMTMSVFERVREIGTLRAIGTKKSSVVLLFLSEGFLVGVIGGALGVLSGILSAIIINNLGGIPMPVPPGRTEGYQAMISLEPGVLLLSFAGTVLVAVVSSIYPACKAANLSVIDALGHT